MILTLTSVEKRHSDKAGDYIQIKGTTPEGEDKTFNIFKQLQPAWFLLKEGARIELKTIQKGANENVQNIKLADEEWPENTGVVEPEEVAEKPVPKKEHNPQEIGLAYKILTEMYIAGFIDENGADGKELILRLKLWLKDVLLGR